MVEEVKTGGTKLAALQKIEREQQERVEAEKLYETQATEGYENMSFEEAQAGKFFCNFPFPYMNGFLHMGKSPFFYNRRSLANGASLINEQGASINQSLAHILSC